MERWVNLTHKHFKHYKISNTGRLMNDETGVVMTNRVQPKTGLAFCDISRKVGEEKVRKTIYITREVAEAFVKKPADFDKLKYVPVHKEGVSKLNNLPHNIIWKTFSEISSDNMAKATPEQRNRLANHNKEKFKNHVKKKYIKVKDRIKKPLSKLEKELQAEKDRLLDRISLIDKLLKQ